MPSHIFITGGSGFVGSAVIDELLARNYSVNALSHSKDKGLDPRVHSISGSLFDAEAIDRGMKNCDAVIHLVGIIMEKRRKGITFDKIHHQGTRSVVDAAKRNGVGRYLQMSALGARPDAVST